MNNKPEQANITKSLAGEYAGGLVKDAEISKVFANLIITKEVAQTVTEHITSPFDVSTPKDKIKKRPDGFDYIENTWMDKEFKKHSPLYKTRLVHYSEAHGWVSIIVELEDRITGNTELGADSARIMVRQGTLEPNFRDIIDKGNNVKSALSRAIKNAQSRFGHGADVYGKREEVRTESDILRFGSMLEQIRKISSTRASLFKEQWEQIGVDYSDYLDKWQSYIDRNTKSSAEAGKVPAGGSTVVTEESSYQKASNASDNAKSNNNKITI